MSRNKIKVLKFGGSSQCIEGYRVIKDLVRYTDYKYIIVVSAIKGITNKLIDYTRISDNKIKKEIIDINNKLIKKCDIDVDPNYSILNTDNIYKLQSKINIISSGEYFTSSILNSYLINNGIKSEFVPAFLVLKSDTNNKNLYNTGPFTVNTKVIDEFFTHSNVIVIPGFSALTPDKNICLLGRGGSDTTGSVIAASVNAEIYQIWTDVNGIYSCDPRIIKDSQLVEKIGYSVAQELASMGAKVLHPYCILPCAKKNIPIEIKNTFNPDGKSTYINGIKSVDTIHGITKQNNISVFKITSMNMWNNYGFVFDIFSHFKNYNVDVNIISTSQFNITTTTNDSDIKKLHLLKIELEKIYNVELITDLSVVNIVGHDIKKNPLISKIFDKIKIYDTYLTGYASNDMTLSFVVNNSDTQDIIECLYKTIFNSYSFEPKEHWWRKFVDLYYHKDDFVGPQYLYNRDIIDERITQLQSVTNVNQFYYAMKANYNIEIIKFIISRGLGIECVNLGELYYLQKCLGKLDFPILFTPNFCSIDDYQDKILTNDNIKLIIDNIDVILKYPDEFSEMSIGLRLDLNCGKGHCDKVITQGKQSKFGISIDKLIKYRDIFTAYNINIEGLHTHMGSSVHNYKNWVKIANRIFGIVNDFDSIKWINLGGGLGIDKQIDFESLNEELGNISSNKEIKLFMEPGRFIVGESGIIIGRVTQIKDKMITRFIGTNIGMNDLIRPALYDVVHPIYFYSPYQKEDEQTVTVVGPICESGDVLVKNLKVKHTITENDIVIVTNTGAYGYSMRSNYNLKEVPIEGFI